MWNRRRRAAISQSQIRKECKLYGAFFEGHRAFGAGIPQEDNPHKGRGQDKYRKAWYHGWNFAKDEIDDA